MSATSLSVATIFLSAARTASALRFSSGLRNEGVQFCVRHLCRAAHQRVAAIVKRHVDLLLEGPVLGCGIRASGDGVVAGDGGVADLDGGRLAGRPATTS